MQDGDCKRIEDGGDETKETPLVAKQGPPVSKPCRATECWRCWMDGNWRCATGESKVLWATDIDAGYAFPLFYLVSSFVDTSLCAGGT